MERKKFIASFLQINERNIIKLLWYLSVVSRYRTSAARKRIMKSVRSKNTRPELLVRSMLHRLGYRFRVHVSNLPSKPDIVFRSRSKVILVNGCFWHAHENCPFSHTPRSRTKYWNEKLSTNRRRDKENLQKLQELGWASLTVWECELADKETLTSKLINFLG